MSRIVHANFKQAALIPTETYFMDNLHTIYNIQYTQIKIGVCHNVINITVINV